MADLSEKEAQKIFEETSKALRENDSAKLSSLLSEEAVPETAPTEEEPAPVVSEEPEIKETPADIKDKEEEQVPPTKAEQTEETKPTEDATEQPELKKLMAELERLSKENHSLRSQAGRVPHIQRRLKELDTKLEEIEKNRTSPSSQPSAKIKPKVDALLKGVKETDPELADAIVQAIVEATDGVAEVSDAKHAENIRMLRKRELEEYQEVEVARLLDMYPNAREVFVDPHWAKWKERQTDRVRQLAESDNADDVSWAFTKYAADMAELYPDLVKVEDKKVETVVQETKSEQAEKIEAERNRKKQTSVVVGSATSPVKGGLPDDPEALFRKYSEDIRKQRTG